MKLTPEVKCIFLYLFSKTSSPNDPLLPLLLVEGVEPGEAETGSTRSLPEGGGGGGGGRGGERGTGLSRTPSLSLHLEQRGTADGSI